MGYGLAHWCCSLTPMCKTTYVKQTLYVSVFSVVSSQEDLFKTSCLYLQAAEKQKSTVQINESSNQSVNTRSSLDIIASYQP